jgi:hypothetical protein
VFIIICVLLYFVPTVIACARNHHNQTPVMLVNLFFGWTFLGWIIALIWASSAVREPRA